MKKFSFFLVFALFISISLIFNPVNIKAEGSNVPQIENESVTTSLGEAPISIPSVDTDVIDGGVDEDGTTNPGEIVRYPKSTIIVKSGDVLISDKSWDATKFVGHSAIVGSDFLVREVLTGSSPNKTTSLSAHRINQSGGTVRIYRHSNTTARVEAGQWAVNNINKVTSYRFSTNLKDVSYNYCSKFVWQAFNKNGYTAGYLSNISLVGFDTHGYVYPESFSSNMKYVGSYK